ncbi:MAG TPA: DEAD/DEAH box helicase [Desulfobacteraceae bacterium]|nr:DEAD/DEAH box helicase [Desulfobacteraceae bacterium]
MNFSRFNFHPSIAAAVQKCGYTSPTPIQEKAIPHLLQGHDLLGLAQTGTGKTAAFVLPTLQRLQNGPRKKIRALILAPTRELAEQIHENIQLMAGDSGLRSCTIFGGVSKHGQIRNIEKGMEIVVACPGRLLDHLNSRTISLRDIEILILDEADQMFDRGFLPDIRRILKQMPAKRQSMVFSATMPGEIRHLVEDILTDPMTIQINHEKPAETISHAFFQVDQSSKTALLVDLLQKNTMTSTLIFTRTKHKAKNLARHLQNAGFRATSIQGNLSQNQRKLAMDGFKSGRFSIMVATDIAARGIDVSDISHVVNYDVPDTAEAYTHRTGRTGRAEKTGQALTFVTADDGQIIKFVERNLGGKIRRETVPGFAAHTAEKARPEPGRTGLRGNSRRKPAAGKWKSRTGRAASFDFGITASAKK